jgi:hypothetical protein
MLAMTALEASATTARGADGGTMREVAWWIAPTSPSSPSWSISIADDATRPAPDPGDAVVHDDEGPALATGCPAMACAGVADEACPGTTSPGSASSGKGRFIPASGAPMPIASVPADDVVAPAPWCAAGAGGGAGAPSPLSVKRLRLRAGAGCWLAAEAPAKAAPGADMAAARVGSSGSAPARRTEGEAGMG